MCPLNRLPLFVTLAALLTLAVVPTGEAIDQPPDGVTALVAPVGHHGMMIAQDGMYHVKVQIFQKDDAGNWSSVPMRATLRVFEDTGPLMEEDRVSIPFDSVPGRTVDIAFPVDAVGSGTLDVFVTFSALGGNPVPTSHHFVGKMAMLNKGWYNNADTLDHHATRVVGVAA